MAHLAEAPAERKSRLERYEKRAQALGNPLAAALGISEEVHLAAEAVPDAPCWCRPSGFSEREDHGGRLGTWSRGSVRFVRIAIMCAGVMSVVENGE